MNQPKTYLLSACLLALFSSGCATHRTTRRESDPPYKRDMTEHRLEFTVRYSDGRPVREFRIHLENDLMKCDYDGHDGEKTVSIYDMDGSLKIIVYDKGNANGGAFYASLSEKDGIHGRKKYRLVLHPVKGGKSKDAAPAVHRTEHR